jgi:hypothetical protein
MTEEMIKQWTDALRSGEYKQGQNSLCRYDKFCCLGVLADLCIKAGLGEWKTSLSMGGVKEFSDIYGGSNAVSLPPSFVSHQGIQSSTGEFLYDALSEEIKAKLENYDIKSWGYSGETTTLAHLNDEGVPFELIADIIEARPEGLFKKNRMEMVLDVIDGLTATTDQLIGCRSEEMKVIWEVDELRDKIKDILENFDEDGNRITLDVRP